MQHSRHPQRVRPLRHLRRQRLVCEPGDGVRRGAGIEGRKCFDCWLLEAQLKQTVHQVYYRQLADWSRAPVSPFSVGAMLALSALPLQPVVKTSQRARLPPAAGKCKACKQGGMLLACSFCTAVYHNTDACLGESKLSPELAASASFPWACPVCFKKGITSVQRIVLKPTGQRAAGAKRTRAARKQ
jgi:hypothetical protein